MREKDRESEMARIQKEKHRSQIKKSCFRYFGYPSFPKISFKMGKR
jgi:hypothetical protein